MLQAEVGSTAKYTIVAKLATGGMAELFLARAESSAGVERYVVLKRVLPNRAHDIKFVNMFLDEARLAARLQHPNIAQVYDTGTVGDSYFFTMEYVHGETVRTIINDTLEANQQIPLACTLTIISGAAAGLQHAHERVGFDGRPLGVVHRDVSPSNLIVSYDGNVKLVDFGVAKATDRVVETQTGAMKGKINYMSPEQVRGATLDARSDLFSLGIVMWQMLVGENLFRRPGDFETMEAIVSDPAPPPSQFRKEISPEIDRLVLRLLEKSPRARYQTADALLDDLELVSNRAGLSLSAVAVRRFMRELFGVRPEPWLDIKRREAQTTEVVTVTGVARLADDTESHSDELAPIHEEPSAVTIPNAHAAESRARSAKPKLISTTSPTIGDGKRPPSPARANPIVPLSPLADEPAGRRPSRRLVLGAAALVCAGIIVFVVASSGPTVDRSNAAPSPRAVESVEPAAPEHPTPPTTPPPSARPAVDTATVAPAVSPPIEPPPEPPSSPQPATAKRARPTQKQRSESVNTRVETKAEPRDERAKGSATSDDVPAVVEDRPKPSDDRKTDDRKTDDRKTDDRKVDDRKVDDRKTDEPTESRTKRPKRNCDSDPMACRR